MVMGGIIPAILNKRITAQSSRRLGVGVLLGFATAGSILFALPVRKRIRIPLRELVPRDWLNVAVSSPIGPAPSGLLILY